MSVITVHLQCNNNKLRCEPVASSIGKQAKHNNHYVGSLGLNLLYFKSGLQSLISHIAQTNHSLYFKRYAVKES